MKASFDIDKIAVALHGFQAIFAEINRGLTLHREALEDDMIDRILQAYGFLNDLLGKDVDLFSLAGLHSMLELNHIVLCGTEPSTRYEYHSHIVDTRKRFQNNIRKTRKWVMKKADAIPPVALATGFYCRMLSRPQLYFEGNHRTGNIILNYLLICASYPPFLITADNAFEYLELSGHIKFMNKDKQSDRWLKWSKYEKLFQSFIERNASDAWLMNEEGTVSV